MQFTMPFFLIGILPWFVILFFLVRSRPSLKKTSLALANVLFYLWGGIGALFMLLAYVLLIWGLSSLLSRQRGKGLFRLAVLLALVPLVAFKYAAFLIQNVNLLFSCELPLPAWVLPLGISFVTFQAVSLLSDVYTRKETASPSLCDTFLFLTFFATITSGPIMRYDRFREGLGRVAPPVDLEGAIGRIIIGLSKKVLVADKLSVLVGYYFDGMGQGVEFSAPGLWIGSFAFTLQLYFDFSGYSDMAIGIGELLGFQIPENFMAPYRSRSVSEFWRRWHISLSQWFRDYVYIPLGGNRCSVPRHIFNLLIVWLLTGIWHGAAHAFIIWGLGYFVLLVAEKHLRFVKRITETCFGHLYVLFFVNLLWIPFRMVDLRLSGLYVLRMFAPAGWRTLEPIAVSFLPFLLFAMALCLPWERLLGRFRASPVYRSLRRIGYVVLLAAGVCAILNSTYAPYIYGNF